MMTYAARSLRTYIDDFSLCLMPYLRKRRYFANVIRATNADLLARRVDPELKILPLFLDPQKAFLDIGAHLGEYCFVAEKHIDPSLIYAFEPQARYAWRIKKLFPRSYVAPVALSDHAGVATLKIPVVRERLYSTRATLEHFSEAGETDARHEPVSLVTLDQFCKEHATPPIGCMKIDVEGHELSVLRGAAGVLAKHKPVCIIEIEQRHHQEPIDTVFAWMSERGYEGYFFDEKSASLHPLAEFSPKEHQDPDTFRQSRYVNNFIFVPQGYTLPDVHSLFLAP